MKKYSKKELQEKSAGYFKSNPDVKEFYTTEDGMFFTDKSLATDHNRKVVKGELHSIARNAEVVPEEPAGELTPNDLEQLRDEYERVTGQKAGNRKAETLLKEIEEAGKEAK
jgi:DNA-binding transcriptional regulator GbsR (MarR family)